MHHQIQTMKKLIYINNKEKFDLLTQKLADEGYKNSGGVLWRNRDTKWESYPTEKITCIIEPGFVAYFHLDFVHNSVGEVISVEDFVIS